MHWWTLLLSGMGLLFTPPVQALEPICSPQTLASETSQLIGQSDHQLIASPTAPAATVIAPAPGVSQSPLLQAAETAYGTGQYAAAEGLFKQLTQQQPNNSEAWKNLGDAQRRQQKSIIAKQSYDRAIQVDRRNIRAYEGRALLTKPDGHTMDALYVGVFFIFDRDLTIQTYETFLKANPDYAEAYRILGDALLQRAYQEGNYQPAPIEVTQDGLVFDEIDWAIKALPARRIHELGSLSQQAHTRFPADANFLNVLTKTLQMEGRNDEALQLYDQQIQQQPHAIELRRQKGHILLRLKRWDEAQTIFCQTLTLYHTRKADPAPALEGLMQTLRPRQRLADIMPIYQQEIQTAPNAHLATQLRYGLAKVLNRLERWDDLIKVYQTMILTAPEEYVAYARLGEGLSKLERFDEGIRAFQSGLKVVENSGQISWQILFHKQIGDFYAKQHKPAKAVLAYRTAIKLSPDAPNAAIQLFELYVALGEVLEQSGDLTGAITAYENALQQSHNPNNPIRQRLANLKQHSN
jgi:tetratricopeptide (TPR) repeat protein